MDKQTFTLTFCETAENHKGMQMIGKIADRGMSLDELLEAQNYFNSKGITTHLVCLNDYAPVNALTDAAYLLIAKNGVSAICNPDELYVEQDKLEKDKKAYMYGRVVNKKARHNLCFADFSQKADFENKKGTVYDFKDLPLTSKVRNSIGVMIPSNSTLKNLYCEGNYYYDIKNTYIGYHGDVERRNVIAVRLGADFPIHYRWYNKSVEVGKQFSYTLSHGDMYFMSDKTVGYDWRSSSKYTLRHAAALNEKLIN